jgi:nucleoside-diphosphate-sugar epimerase
MAPAPSDSARKAVVLGGAGFVGQRLLAALLRAPGAPERPDAWPAFDHVHVLDLLPVPAGPGLTTQVGDIRSRADLREALRGAHTVFHLASIVDVGLRRNPRIEEVNVGGTRNVVEICQELGVPFLVYTSSEDVVLSRAPVAGGDESIPYPSDPLHDYVRTKIAGERLAREAHGRGGFASCAVRPVHIYGPGDPHAIKTSLRAFARGSVPFLLGDGSAKFDIVYVDNVVHGHLLAAARLHDDATRGTVGGSAYFLGEDNAPNYFDFLRPYARAKGIAMPRRHLGNRATLAAALLMELVHRVTGADVPFHRFHYQILTQHFYFDGKKAERELGYRPLVTPDEGLRRTLQWLDGESFSP